MSTTSNTTAKSVVYEGPERPTRPETWDLGVPRVRANTLRLMLDHLRERYGDDVLSLACLDCGSEDCRDPGHDQARETVGDPWDPPTISSGPWRSSPAPRTSARGTWARTATSTTRSRAGTGHAPSGTSSGGGSARTTPGTDPATSGTTSEPEG
jgi:hypothetical protein